jgi:hypothetical protein
MWLNRDFILDFTHFNIYPLLVGDYNFTQGQGGGAVGSLTGGVPSAVNRFLRMAAACK